MSNGNNFRLTDGRTYTWTFHYIDGKPTGSGPGMGTDRDARSLIWQMHDYGASGASASLGFANDSSGKQIWDFSLGGTPLYVWTGSYTQGETDDFKIVVKVSSTSNGTEQLYRNGQLVMNVSGPNYSAGTNPWWNFGPYKWRWGLPNAGGSTTSRVNATISGMTLTTP